MSPKLFGLFLILYCAQFLLTVQGEKPKEIDAGIQFPRDSRGVGSSGRYMDEQTDLIREKRAPVSTTPKTAKTGGRKTNKKAAPAKGPTPEGIKRAKGFVKIYTALSGTLVALGVVNIGLFIWLSITLKKVKKP